MRSDERVVFIHGDWDAEVSGAARGDLDCKRGLGAVAGYPFYQRLHELLDAEKFDEFVEAHCRKFYSATMGRPGLVPGIYFRSLLIGYFEGIDNELGIAWLLAYPLALRQFERISLTESTPDHSTISRTGG